MSDSRVCCRVESLICQFDVKRAHHKNCVARLHYVYASKDRLEIYHSNEELKFDSVLVFSTREIHGVFVTEDQRGLLRNRLKALLKGEL